MNRKSYSEMMDAETFDERFEYLKLGGKAGVATFGDARYMNQAFYASDEWRSVRDDVILRDDGCDLGIPGREINGTIYVHHINPMTKELLAHGDPSVIDPNNLVCVSYNTHKALHYGDISMLKLIEPIVRKPNDTCPWKGGTL